MIKIVAEMGSTNSTDADSSVNAIYAEENTDPSEATSINSVPLLAIGLAIVASCNSGKPLYLSDRNRVSTQQHKNNQIFQTTLINYFQS